jgi:mxaJ protein
LLVARLLCVASAVAPARELRVCADPDNLPLSHADGSGFENRIARLVADEMGAT